MRSDTWVGNQVGRNPTGREEGLHAKTPEDTQASRGREAAARRGCSSAPRGGGDGPPPLPGLRRGRTTAATTTGSELEGQGWARTGRPKEGGGRDAGATRTTPPQKPQTLTCQGPRRERDSGSEHTAGAGRGRWRSRFWPRATVGPLGTGPVTHACNGGETVPPEEAAAAADRGKALARDAGKPTAKETETRMRKAC
jgi:hypothetical protein